MKPLYWTTVVFLLVAACGERTASPAEEVLATRSYHADTAFWQEYHEAYPLTEAEGIEARSIVVDAENQVWIATPTGAYRKAPGARVWTAVFAPADQGPAFAVETDMQGAVWISTWNGVYRYINGSLQRLATVPAPAGVLCNSAEGMYALGPSGVWLCKDDACAQKKYDVARSIRDAVSDNRGGLWIASDVGLYHSDAQGTRRFLRPDEIISAYVRGVALIDHTLWAGGLGGVTVLRDGNMVKSLRPENGIPSVYVRSVRRAPDGVMWVGTDVGVVRYKPDSTHSLRFTRRWLVDDQVNDIAFDAQGDAWIATAKGVSAIRRRQMTLASKQSYFYDVLMRRHIRDPWIAGQCRLPIAGDTAQWEPEDDDNDGEYTGNYLAMESFRYATTKSNDAKKKARKAFLFLKQLQEVTGTDGFFARTIVPAGFKRVHDGNRKYTERERADELVKEPRFKPVEVRWHKSKDGKWLWKGDTSSDEICGHMFGYFFYYELAADTAEKIEVAAHVANMVDHLMANNFTLTDVDGKPTRWGVWSPDKLNRDAEWSPDRSLNSMELLSFLKLAYHVTRNGKYERAYRHLIKEERYLDNMAYIPHQNPAWFIYFDVMLAAYQYPILLKCEKDPELLKFYQDHIDNWFDMRKDDQNPLINFIYSYSRGKEAALNASVAFLTDAPLDLVDWPIDHSKREDIQVVRHPVLDELQVSTLQPASLRATVRWDKNPWTVAAGNPHVEREPVYWLLPYWMGRYLQMIR